MPPSWELAKVRSINPKCQGVGDRLSREELRTGSALLRCDNSFWRWKQSWSPLPCSLPLSLLFLQHTDKSLAANHWVLQQIGQSSTNQMELGHPISETTWRTAQRQGTEGAMIQSAVGSWTFFHLFLLLLLQWFWFLQVSKVSLCAQY